MLVDINRHSNKIYYRLFNCLLIIYYHNERIKTVSQVINDCFMGTCKYHKIYPWALE